MGHISWDYIAHRAEVWERKNGRFDAAVHIQNMRKALGDTACQTESLSRLDDAARRMT